MISPQDIKGLPPAYGGCTCSCHRVPGIMHIAPCCKPENSPASEALRLLAAEDERNTKLHDFVEEIREQLRLEVEPSHLPKGLMTKVQQLLYAFRGRTLLMNDAAIVGPLVNSNELLEALRACHLELTWCKAQLAGDGYESREGGSVCEALRIGRAALSNNQGAGHD